MRGAYIAQINRLIFVNNFLILAKGRSARLSRRRRRNFRPSRGNLPLARACARIDARIDGRQIDHDLLWSKRSWSGSLAYAESKLCDVLLAFAIARRWKGVKSNALLEPLFPVRRGVRLLGISLSSLAEESEREPEFSLPV